MELNQAEQNLFYWQFGTAGSFTTKLFELIGNGDIPNQNKLALGFPDEVTAYRRYANEAGYWDNIQKEMRS